MSDEETSGTAPGPAPGRPSRPAAGAGQATDDAEFDLRDLARPDDDLSSGFTPLLSGLADPFEMLGASRACGRQKADPLAGLLGTGSTRPPFHGASHERLSSWPVPADALEAADIDGAAAIAEPLRASTFAGAMQQSEDVSRLEPHAIGAGVAKAASRDVLKELHDEFVRVIRDPGQISGKVEWDAAARSVVGLAPSLDDLSRAAEPFASLRDVLQRRTSIDDVINSMDALGEQRVLDEFAPEDVLQIFAPGLSQHQRMALPGLTRREHHAVATDSYMKVSSTRRNEEQQ